jgi:hypothetical protein
MLRKRKTNQKAGAPALKGFTGLEKDAPIVTNERGGVSSGTAFAYHLIDPVALQELAKVMRYGEQKGYLRDNWRLLSIEDHLNHTIMHIMAHQAGDKQDDHLEHAFTRMMMAVAIKHRPDYLGCLGKQKRLVVCKTHTNRRK